MRHFARFCLIAAVLAVSAISPVAQTVTAIFNVSNFVSQAVNVQRLTITPWLPGPAATQGAFLSPYIPPFTRANTPSLTNGTVTVSNIIMDYAYSVCISDGYQNFSNQVFFDSRLIGTNATVNAANYITVNVNPNGPYAIPYLPSYSSTIVSNITYTVGGGALTNTVATNAPVPSLSLDFSTLFVPTNYYVLNSTIPAANITGLGSAASVSTNLLLVWSTNAATSQGYQTLGQVATTAATAANAATNLLGSAAYTPASQYLTNFITDGTLTVTPNTNFSAAILNSGKVFTPLLGSNYVQLALNALVQSTNRQQVGGGHLCVIGQNFFPNPLTFTNSTGGIQSVTIDSPAFTFGALICQTNPCIRITQNPVNYSANFQNLIISSLDNSPTNLFEAFTCFPTMALDNCWFGNWGMMTNNVDVYGHAGLVVPTTGPPGYRNLQIFIQGIGSDKIFMTRNHFLNINGIWWSPDHGYFVGNQFSFCAGSNTWASGTPESLGACMYLEHQIDDDWNMFGNFFYGGNAEYFSDRNSSFGLHRVKTYDDFAESVTYSVLYPTNLPISPITQMNPAAQFTTLQCGLVSTNPYAIVGQSAGQVIDLTANPIVFPGSFGMFGGTLQITNSGGTIFFNIAPTALTGTNLISGAGFSAANGAFTPFYLAMSNNIYSGKAVNAAGLVMAGPAQNENQNPFEIDSADGTIEYYYSQDGVNWTSTSPTYNPAPTGTLIIPANIPFAIPNAILTNATVSGGTLGGNGAGLSNVVATAVNGTLSNNITGNAATATTASVATRVAAGAGITNAIWISGNAGGVTNVPGASVTGVLTNNTSGNAATATTASVAIVLAAGAGITNAPLISGNGAGITNSLPTISVASLPASPVNGLLQYLVTNAVSLFGITNLVTWDGNGNWRDAQGIIATANTNQFLANIFEAGMGGGRGNCAYATSKLFNGNAPYPSASTASGAFTMTTAPQAVWGGSIAIQNVATNSGSSDCAYSSYTTTTPGNNFAADAMVSLLYWTNAVWYYGSFVYYATYAQPYGYGFIYDPSTNLTVGQISGTATNDLIAYTVANSVRVFTDTGFAFTNATQANPLRLSAVMGNGQAVFYTNLVACCTNVGSLPTNNVSLYNWYSYMTNLNTTATGGAAVGFHETGMAVYKSSGTRF